MQSDRYLRAVLTVIAVCLVWICLRDASIVGTASARSGEVMDVNILQLDGVEVGMHIRGFPVRVQNWQ